MDPLIRHLYACQHKLPHYNRLMFHKPLEDRLKLPVSVLSVWLRLATPAFRADRLDTDDETVDDVSTEPPESLFHDHESPN
jgi:hypothetical protein